MGKYKTTIKETKQQLIEKDEGTETFKNKRYNEECKFAIKEIKKAREVIDKRKKGERKAGILPQKKRSSKNN
jgi:lysyl-tRNA synthetase class I